MPRELCCSPPLRQLPEPPCCLPTCSQTPQIPAPPRLRGTQQRDGCQQKCERLKGGPAGAPGPPPEGSRSCREPFPKPKGLAGWCRLSTAPGLCVLTVRTSNKCHSPVPGSFQLPGGKPGPTVCIPKQLREGCEPRMPATGWWLQPGDCLPG